jgi:hypothetical protein
MLRYLATAAALKLFSCGAPMQRLYRILGNSVGSRKRLLGEIPSYYFERIRRFLALSEKYNFVKDGSKIMEVGTGWVHWEALTIRLFFDVHAVMFDRWDNRQFYGLKHYFSLLDELIDERINLTQRQSQRAHRVIKDIFSADSLDALYKRLQLAYIVGGIETLSQFPENSFDLIVSAAVLEHVDKTILYELVGEFSRLLRPGGYSIHSIDLSDHIQHYDKRVSERCWQRCFHNEVQYFNRLQRPEWLRIFNGAGLRLIGEDPDYTPIGSLKIDKQYQCLDKSDIACTYLRIVHQKPFI